MLIRQIRCNFCGVYETQLLALVERDCNPAVRIYEDFSKLIVKLN
jgi:hypothetical protein